MKRRTKFRLVNLACLVFLAFALYLNFGKKDNQNHFPSESSPVSTGATSNTEDKGQYNENSNVLNNGTSLAAKPVAAL